jgi:hypothetical protein
MIVSIHQPNYMPWLGYFYKIYKSDKFVFLDDVQFSNEGMHNYHFLKTPQGPFRLKIPVKHSMGDSIDSIVMREDLQWRKKHLKTIEMNYKKSPHYEEVYNDLLHLFANEETLLSRFNEQTIKFICNKFGFKTLFVNSSDLKIDSTREDKVIKICKEVGATTYYSGAGAKIYQVEDNFTNNGLKLEYSNYKVVTYPQLWGDYTANVFIIDYLMNCGYDWDRVMEIQL